MKDINRILLGVAILLLTLVLLRDVTPLVRIHGESMAPTYHDQEIVLVSALKDLPGVQDVVVFTFEGEYLIKRVVGLPGDTIEIRAGHLYRNGQILPEDYLGESPSGNYPLVTVPQGKLFVLGDNRPVSLDSRSPEVGFVPLESLLGTVLLSLP